MTADERTTASSPSHREGVHRTQERPGRGRTTGSGKAPRRHLRIAAGVLLASALVYFLFSGNILSRFIESDHQPPAGMNDTGRRIQLNVLNGCGVPGIAMKMTGHLRSLGYDVVEMGNYENSRLERSMIIDWTGDTTTAQKIAAAVDLQGNRIVHKKSSKEYVEFSVVLGKDYTKLIPLRPDLPAPGIR